jgi:hypothetical protein
MPSMWILKKNSRNSTKRYQTWKSKNLKKRGEGSGLPVAEEWSFGRRLLRARCLAGPLRKILGCAELWWQWIDHQKPNKVGHSRRDQNLVNQLFKKSPLKPWEDHQKSQKIYQVSINQLWYEATKENLQDVCQTVSIKPVKSDKNARTSCVPISKHLRLYLKLQ